MKYAIIENGIVANVALAAGPMAPNWIETDAAGIGWTYSDGIFTEPLVIPPPVVIDPCEWLIDVGPWKDRFDTMGYPGLKGLVLALGRTNDICYAAHADLVGRKYVDMKARRQELLTILAAIAGVVAAANYPEFTLAMRLVMVDTPASAKENEALRNDYFS